jgi:hypothetical protein
MESQLTFLSEELRARPSASPDSERDWQIRVATSRSSILTLLHELGPAGWYGRTSPASLPPGQMTRTIIRESIVKDGRECVSETLLHASSEGWRNSGMGSPTAFLTLNMSEWNHTLAPSLKDEGVFSLSDILETGDVPLRYFLSARACRGILRRAERRGKRLPEHLELALLRVADSEPISTATEELSPKR